jgi:hypothetical protein
MTEIDALDQQIRTALTEWPVVYLLRIGSSLNPKWFTTTSDIDYILVTEYLTRYLIKDFPNRISPELPVKWNDAERIYGFFWRLNVREVEGHKVTICIYTADKFYQYIETRSPPKMYVLHENKLLIGDENELERLKEENPPDKRTAEADFKALSCTKYRHAFPWEWRSVALLREPGKWLNNKEAITQWVSKNYPGQLENVALLRGTLEKELGGMRE